jgi:hypothetical protein
MRVYSSLLTSAAFVVHGAVSVWMEAAGPQATADV